LSGIALQAINPKAYVVNTALFTGFPFELNHYWLEVAIKFALINAVWIPIHLLWMMAGLSVQKMNLSARTQRVVSVFMGMSLLMVVILALTTLSLE